MSEPLMYEAGGFSAFRDKWKGAGHSKLPVGGGGGILKIRIVQRIIECPLLGFAVFRLLK